MPVPNSFSPNTQIKSAQVNENNTYITDMIDIDGDGHTAVKAGASKLVKTQVLRQDDTTNSYVGNQVVLTGWTWASPGAGALGATKSITFGVTFASAPVVILGNLGMITSGDPDSIDDFDTFKGKLATHAYNVATTGFDIEFRNGDAATFSTGERVGASWIAIGTIS